jgi:hypothetical protein
VADPAQLVTVLGAAGALLLVLKWVVDGKLHSSSEVDGLREDKKALLAINAALSEAIDKSNDQLTMIIGLLREEPRNGPP